MNMDCLHDDSFISLKIAKYSNFEDYDNQLISLETQRLYVKDFFKDIDINSSKIRLRLSEKMTENTILHLKNAFIYCVSICIHSLDKQVGSYQFLTEEINYDNEYLIFHKSECDVFDKDTLSIWYKHAELTPKYWLALNRDQKRKWLNVCYKKCEFEGFDLKVENMKIIDLDLSIIDDELDFYCLIGEETRGILGYAGYNLDALEDFISYNMDLKFNILNYDLFKNKNIENPSLNKVNTIIEILASR